MVKAFYNEQVVSIDGEDLRLVLNFATIDAAESLLAPLTFENVVGQMLDGTAPTSTQARVVWALLREHHPDLTIDQASSLVIGPSSEAVGVAIGKLILAAFPITEGKAKSANPPKPRGASKTS